MLEFCEKLYFFKPNNGFQLDTVHYSGEQTSDGYINPRDSIYDSFTYDISKVDYEIVNVDKNKFNELFETALKLKSNEELLDFYNTNGMYIDSQIFHTNKEISSSDIDIIHVRKFLILISNIKELIDLIAARDGNDKRTLEKYFEWSLRKVIFIRKYKTDYPDSGISPKGYPPVWLNNIILPDFISSNYDNKKATDYVIKWLMSADEMTSPLNINFEYNDRGGMLNIIPRTFASFLYLYFADTLLSGTKYKICEMCGVTFPIEVKPGREPSVCSDTCRARKFRRKQNERHINKT